MGQSLAMGGWGQVELGALELEQWEVAEVIGYW